MKLRLVMDAIRHGRGLAVAARGGARIELHNVQPGTMTVSFDAFGEPSCKVQDGTAERIYAWSDVVDLCPIPEPNGQALSIVGAAREAIGFATTLQKHGSRLFANGARPGGLLTFAEKLSAVEAGTLVTPPARDVFNDWLPEAKVYLGRDGDAHDGLIDDLIRTAAGKLDGPLGRLGRALAPQTWRLDVQEVAFDPKFAAKMMARLAAEGLPAVQLDQRPLIMGPLYNEVQKLIIGRRFRHGRHPVLRWCVQNAVPVYLEITTRSDVKS